MMNKYHVPQYLDEPFKIMLWTIDEFLIFLIPFMILMLVFNSPIFGMIVGLIFMMGIRKIKGEQGHYFIYNLMYWYLPTMFRFKRTPASYLRHFLG